MVIPQPGAAASVLPMGERAILVETAGTDEAVALHAALAASPPDGVVELVPAARTVMVVVDPRRLTLAAARAWVRRAPAVPAGRDAVEQVELAVAYDGPDLDETAALLGIRPADLVARHVAATWTVAFTGFAPGFGYLTSPDWPFDVPRLATPRTRVPAGAVGLAGVFSGAYPRATPGGWRLIGTTDAELFDPARTPAVLLAPGTRVRLRAVDRAALSTGRGGATDRPVDGGDARRPAAPRGTATRPPGLRGTTTRRPGLRVTATGPLATVQDRGRPASAALGVAPSGALDRGALAAALRLLGDDERAAGIEITLGGFAAVAERDLWVAVTGAWGPVRIDGREVDLWAAHRWPAGTELRVDAPHRGIRSYLAVRGGIDAAPVLGSRATDTLAGLGPARLAAGDRLAVGVEPDRPIPPSDLVPWSPPPERIELDVAPGPRADRLVEAARLFETEWTASDRADRVGIRLDGPPLGRRDLGELPSEGMLPGAIQVPPDGRPVVLLADGPVTGGYPVVGVVTAAGLDLLAQARPGTRIRFRHARPRG